MRKLTGTESGVIRCGHDVFWLPQRYKGEGKDGELLAVDIPGATWQCCQCVPPVLPCRLTVVQTWAAQVAIEARENGVNEEPALTEAA